MHETFCGEAANSLAGKAREGIFASGEAASVQLDSSPFLSRPARLFALAFGTEVRAGTHSRRLRRLMLQWPVVASTGPNGLMQVTGE